MSNRPSVSGRTPLDFFLDAFTGAALFNNYYGELLKPSSSEKTRGTKGVEIFVRRGIRAQGSDEGLITLAGHNHEKSA